MPFSLSHPAAVIPLARKPLVPSALVVGSMVPDVPYLFSMSVLRGTTHRPIGIVTIDLALGVALLAVFHLLWKRPMVALAPPWLGARLVRPAQALKWRTAVRWALPSLLIGILTHVFWDAFTHKNHGFAGVLPWLVTSSFAGLELYRWLQYASGLIGVALIAIWALRWARQAPPEEGAPETNRPLVWAFLVSAAVAGGLFGLITQFNQPHGTPWGFHAATVSGVVSAMGAALLALTAYSVTWLIKDARRLRTPT